MEEEGRVYKFTGNLTKKPGETFILESICFFIPVDVEIQCMSSKLTMKDMVVSCRRCKEWFVKIYEKESCCMFSISDANLCVMIVCILLGKLSSEGALVYILSGGVTINKRHGYKRLLMFINDVQ